MFKLFYYLSNLIKRQKIGDKEHPLVIINYFMVKAFLFGGIMTLKYWQTPSFIEYLLLLSLGSFGYFGQLYMTKAFQLHEANVIAPLKYLEVVFMIIIGAFWFDEIYNFYTFVGIFLILLIYNLFI